MSATFLAALPTFALHLEPTVYLKPFSSRLASSPALMNAGQTTPLLAFGTVKKQGAGWRLEGCFHSGSSLLWAWVSGVVAEWGLGASIPKLLPLFRAIILPAVWGVQGKGPSQALLTFYHLSDDSLPRLQFLLLPNFTISPMGFSFFPNTQ